QANLLEGAAHTGTPAQMACHGGAIAAEVGDATRRGTNIAADDLKQGRLAGAVWSDQAHHLAFAYREGDVAQRHDPAEIARNAVDLERERRRVHRELPAIVFLNTVPTMPCGAYRTTTSRIKP